MSFKGVIKVKYKDLFSSELGANNVLEVSKGGFFTAYVDKECLGKDTKFVEGLLEKTKWILVNITIWNDFVRDYSSLKERFEQLKSLGHIEFQKQGSKVTLNLNELNDSLGKENYLISYLSISDLKDKRHFIKCVLLDKPTIRFACFKIPVSPIKLASNCMLYGQSVKLNIETHSYPSSGGVSVSCLFKFYKDDSVYLGEEERIIESGKSYNRSVDFDFFIDPAWKKKSEHEVGEIQKYYVKVLTCYADKNARPEDFVFPVYDTKKFSGVSVYDNKLHKYVFSDQYLGYIPVQYDNQSVVFDKLEKSKNNQIQYIGDVPYNTQEYDPCGFEEIVISEDKRNFVIFNEGKGKGKFIDKTGHSFDIIRGDDPAEDVLIEIKGLTNNKKCEGVMLPEGKKHQEWGDVFQMEKAYAVLSKMANIPGKFYYLEEKKNWYDYKVPSRLERFQNNKVGHIEQVKDGIYDSSRRLREEKSKFRSKVFAIEDDGKDDTDVLMDKTKTPVASSVTQGLVLGEHYNSVGKNGIKLNLPYHYDKTFFEGSCLSKLDLFNDLWKFKYFWLSHDMAQNYYVPISTCRYPNQIARVSVYPEVSWKVKFFIVPKGKGSRASTSNEFKEIEKDLAPWLDSMKFSKNYSFNGNITVDCNNDRSEVTAGIISNINPILEKVGEFKDFLDKICFNKERTSGYATKMIGKIKHITDKNKTIEFKLPSFKVQGDWRFKKDSNYPNKVIRHGKVFFGFDPIIEAIATLDLIPIASQIPAVRATLRALDIAEFILNKSAGEAMKLNKEIVFCLTLRGKLQLGVDVDMVAFEDTRIKVKAGIYIGLLLSAKLSISSDKISWSADDIKDDVKDKANTLGTDKTKKNKKKDKTKRKNLKIEAGFKVESESGLEASLFFGYKKNKGLCFDGYIDFTGLVIGVEGSLTSPNSEGATKTRKIKFKSTLIKREPKILEFT